MSAHDTTPDWVCSEAEPRHLNRMALNATTCAWDVMCCTLVVCVPVATCDVSHAAEVGEEAFEGGEMWQAVTALHVPVVILPPKIVSSANRYGRGTHITRPKVQWSARSLPLAETPGADLLLRVCFITAGPITKLFAWGGRRVEDMCYERRRAEACVD
jgi:hypothetical protein